MNIYNLKIAKRLLFVYFGIPLDVEVFKISRNSIRYWKDKSKGVAICRIFQNDLKNYGLIFSLLNFTNERGAINTASVNNKDTEITEIYPTSNYGTQIYLEIGRNAEYPNGYVRDLIHFTLSSGSGVISAVKLYLYKYQDIPGYTCPANEVHELTQTGWTETGATWNKYDGVNNWATPGGDFSATVVDLTNNPLPQGTFGWEDWDLGPGAGNPIAGLTWGSEVHLLLKYPSSTTLSYLTYYSKNYDVDPSKRPYIEITYEEPSGTSFVAWIN